MLYFRSTPQPDPDFQSETKIFHYTLGSGNPVIQKPSLAAGILGDGVDPSCTPLNYPWKMVVALCRRLFASRAMLVLEGYIENSWLLKHLVWFNEFIWLSTVQQNSMKDLGSIQKPTKTQTSENNIYFLGLCHVQYLYSLG